MIEIEDIWHQYGTLVVLNGFTAQLQPGKIYGLMGPNGAGKTSLLKVLAGIYPIQRGQIRLYGKNLSNLSLTQRSRLLSYIPQLHHSCFAYTVMDVVRMGRYPYGEETSEDTNSQVINDIIQRCLDETELWPLRNRSILELSGGELQRVYLARALAQQSTLLVMDEPFTFLDLRQQTNIGKILRRYTLQGHTVLMSLHDIALAQKICDEVILIRDGKAFMRGPSSSVLLDSHLGELYSLTWTL